MTRSEFNVWVKRHQALFPKLTDWLGDQEQPGVILDAWASAMATCAAAHASDATDRMLRGVAPLVEFNDWASLPAVVIAHCRPLGSGKQERTGDGNFVSGAAAGALRKAFREKPPESDAETFNEFVALIGVMSPDDLEDTKGRILNRLGDGQLGMYSAHRLIVMAMERKNGNGGGNALNGIL
jgi:hypothetical protein